MASFHLHWCQRDLSYDNIFSSLYPIVASPIFSTVTNLRTLFLISHNPSSLAFVLLTLLSMMNHVSRCDLGLSISSVDFWRCPLFLFLFQPPAIRLHLFRVYIETTCENKIIQNHGDRTLLVVLKLICGKTSYSALCLLVASLSAYETYTDQSLCAVFNGTVVIFPFYFYLFIFV